MNLALPLLQLPLRTASRDGRPTVWDPFRKKWVALTPEEHVRQLLLQFLTQQAGYPAGRIGVEKKVPVNGRPRRFDAVVFDASHAPWMLVECKAPEVEVTEATLQQLLHYHRSLQCRYWLLSNGRSTFCADACEPEAIRWLAGLPAYG